MTFTYDNPNIVNSKGKLTTVSSSVSATNYTAFDILGRIKSSTQTTGGQTYNFADYSYDLSGALVSQAYPSGRVVTTETDDLGRLGRIASQLPNQVQKTMISQLDYTSFGAVKQARLGNGKWESAQFDNKTLQVTQIGLGGSAGDTSLLKLEFNYGTTANNGSLLQQKITVPGAANQITQNYSYDTFNRLYSATETVTGNSTPTWKQTFSYDRFGNRRFDANNTTTFGSCSQAVCNPIIDKNNNQFSTSDGYSYNAEGSLTANPESQSFAYDAENRLITVQNSATQASSSYQYDGQGNRVKKTVGNQETYFVYDAFGKLTSEYTVNQTPTQNGTQYLTADALGSPRVLTKAIGGVVSRHDYMPYGEEVSAGIGGRTATQGYGQTDNARQKFTGYERDEESGLDFAQNRYFSSKHARFTSVDPLAASASIKAPQSLNRYSYGNNSPYKFTDPLGLAPTLHCWNGICSTYTADEQADDGFKRTLGAESARAEADYDQRVNNTIDAANANAAIAKGDQKRAEAICAANPGVTCNRNDSTSAESTVGSPVDTTQQQQEQQALLKNYIMDSPAGRFIANPDKDIIFGVDDNGKVVAEIIFSDSKAAADALNNAKDQFKNAKLGRKHKDELGEKRSKNVYDFRSYTTGSNRLGDMSLQINIGKTSGRARADLDRFNPAQDLAGAFGHFFLELIPNKFK